MADCTRSDCVASTPARSEDSPLLVANLLNDFTELCGLLLGELARGSWLDAYLLAAGVSQVTEDYLHPDPFSSRKVAKHAARLPSPVGPLAASTLLATGASIARLAARQPRARRWFDWHLEWARLVERLAEHVVNDSGHAAAPPGELLASTRALVRRAEHAPLGLRRSVLRLPSCFRSFDQQLPDLERLVARFDAGWPDRARPLAVVGVRTSGSYLAPLYAALLRIQGYQDVAALTVRPGRALFAPERAGLRRVARSGGVALLVDDPPTSGGALATVAAELERTGFRREAIVLVLQLFGTADDLPPVIRTYPGIVLSWSDWAVHARLAPAAVQRTLAELLGATAQVTGVERLPLRDRNRVRGHAQALYAVQIRDPETGRCDEQRVYVRGAGLGYFGAHSLAMAGSLSPYLPRIYGLRAGVLLREWLPEERKLSLIDLAPEKREWVAEAVAAYVWARHRAYPVAEDISLRLTDRDPVWQAASALLGRSFRRGALLVRPLLLRTTRRLLAVRRPSVIDGSTGLRHWFVGDQPATVQKVDWDERAFSNLDRSCYDPVYDLAGVAASRRDETLRAALRRAYEHLSGERIGPERWLLYELVQLEESLREGVERRPEVESACAAALQRYYAEVFFADLAPAGAGPVCAIDLDGVLESQDLGFLGLTPAGALALRALTLHGYRPVLATGRSLGDLCDRCRAYALAGGLAEYGAAIYDVATGRVRELLSAPDRDALDAVRMALRALEGVHLDPDYRYGVRAYRLGRAGERHGLEPALASSVLEATGCRSRVRAIAGRAQTDFMACAIDKGVGVRALLEEIGADQAGPDGALLALGVGDSVSDLPLLALASRAAAPANADEAVHKAGVPLMRQPCQLGLLQAVTELLGHRPGKCATCRAPNLAPEARLLFTILAAQDARRWGKLRQATLLTWQQLRSQSRP